MHADLKHYVFGRYRMRADDRVVYFDGRPVELAPKVADTLLVFAVESGRIISKTDLMDRIWPGAFVDEANLTQNIYLLRKMFAEHASGVRIENLPKRGYRLVVPEPLPPARAPVVRFAPAVALACVLLLGIGGSTAVWRARSSAGPYGLPASALQQYLLGRYYLDRGTEGDLQRSIASFERLVDEQPQSALGYAGLADGFTSLTFATTDAAERMRLSARAIGLANEAVARDPDCADANAARGAVQTSLEHDDVAASRSFQTALHLEPRNFDALVWYGTELMNQGRVLLARDLFARALGVEPASPGAVASLAWADFLARDYPAAVAFSEQLLRARRLESLAHLTLASSYVEMGDYARALPHIAVLERSRDTRTQGAALLSQVYALRGAAGRARAALASLESETNPERIGAWDILALAAACERVGRPDAAFVWLARIRPSERRQLARDPRFDRLRRDRRFSNWLSG